MLGELQFLRIDNTSKHLSTVEHISLLVTVKQFFQIFIRKIRWNKITENYIIKFDINTTFILSFFHLKFNLVLHLYWKGFRVYGNQFDKIDFITVFVNKEKVVIDFNSRICYFTLYRLYVETTMQFLGIAE